ncbi:hypothetical protein D3C73_920320 [compost metagenome]
MRCNGNIISFCHSCDFASFQNPAGVGKIRLDNVYDALCQQLLKSPTGIHSFACGDRAGGIAGDFPESFIIFGQHRLLNEHRAIRLHLFYQYFGHRLMYPSVKVNADSHVLADRLAHSCDTADSGIDFADGINIMHFFGCIHFDRCKPGCYLSFSRLAHFTRAIASYPGVDSRAVPTSSAKQIINGCVVKFTFNVPEGLFNPRNRAGENRPATIKAPTIQNLKNILNAHRISTDQIVAHFQHRRLNGIGFSFNDGFTPTGNAFAGLNFQKQPSWGHFKQFQFCDFHLIILPTS